ncbi:pancreatic lipase-related protein 2 [Halyomorpha halys]|uniref:pancreatic lipase-related protein 2 n=1 Tax=Halyomorpha halys TaxID=286706 RepID=UPI0034D29866
MTTLGVAEVGAAVGRMVCKLLNAGLVTLDHIHLVGHSLGAHVMGTAGSFVRDSGIGKVNRITGLDPARPGYEQVREESVRLDSDDGQFVDIIHTSVGLFGYMDALGHADFYPNGGYNYQPGCSLTPNIFCSHMKALEYFRESIDNELAFPSVKCDSFFKYALNQCESKEVFYMGQPTPSSTRGTYYLQTFTDANDDETN